MGLTVSSLAEKNSVEEELLGLAFKISNKALVLLSGIGIGMVEICCAAGVLGRSEAASGGVSSWLDAVQDGGESCEGVEGVHSTDMDEVLSGL